MGSKEDKFMKCIEQIIEKNNRSYDDFDIKAEILDSLSKEDARSFIKGNSTTHNEDSFLSGNNRKNSLNESN